MVGTNSGTVFVVELTTRDDTDGEVVRGSVAVTVVVTIALGSLGKSEVVFNASLAGGNVVEMAGTVVTSDTSVCVVVANDIILKFNNR